MRAPPLTPLAAAVLHVPAPERALAVGCGAGEPALLLAREFPSARVRGVDRSAARVREASDRVGLDPEGRIAFKVAGGRSLPFPDAHFDLVALVDHRTRPAEIARVLRPGGYLVVVFPLRPAGLLGRFGAKLRRRRLDRHGFEPLQEARAGDGNFLVARRSDGD